MTPLDATISKVSAVAQWDQITTISEVTHTETVTIVLQITMALVSVPFANCAKKSKFKKKNSNQLWKKKPKQNLVFLDNQVTIKIKTVATTRATTMDQWEAVEPSAAQTEGTKKVGKNLKFYRLFYHKCCLPYEWKLIEKKHKNTHTNDMCFRENDVCESVELWG